jgi:hypothetical protein
MRWL